MLTVGLGLLIYGISHNHIYSLLQFLYFSLTLVTQVLNSFCHLL